MRNERRTLLKTISTGAALLSATAASAEDVDARPNIVFIFADDWGWGDLSLHGHPYIQTPNIDRLASEGIRFQQFNVLAPVCSPSRTAALTGQFPARWSVHQHFGPNNASNDMGDWLDPKAPSIARLLQKGGYRTGHFGKWHLSNILQPKLSGEARYADAPLPAEYGFDEAAVWNGPGANLHFHQAGERAAQFIKNNADRPFYVNVWLHESHTPHCPTEDSMEMFSHLNKVDQVYAAVIADGDRWVGQVLDALEEAGVVENTIVVFSSDNGPERPSSTDSYAERSDLPDNYYSRYYSVGSTAGLRGKKRSLFEGGVRVPFIVRWPGKTPAGEINHSTVLTAVDLFPTFAAVAGVELPEGYQSDGENVLDALCGKDYERSTPAFWEWRGPKWDPDFWPALAVRDGDWKLVKNDEGRIELYQLPADRAEVKDVAAQHPEIVNELNKMLMEWKASLPTEVNPETISKHRP